MQIKKWLIDMPDYIPGRTLEEIKEEYGLKKVYKLASNENMEGPHQEVVQAICRAASRVNYYPDASCTRLRKKLASILGTDQDSIIMGNGTDQIIEMLCDCYVGRGDNVVVADPTFLIYEKSALKCGAEIKKVPLKGYQQDLDAMAKAIDNRTKILFLTSPHNPTGTIISKKDFTSLACNINHRTMIVLDEAYYEYVPDGLKLDSVGYLKIFPQLVVLRTFSKIFGLAGLRVGYGLANKDIIANLNRIRLPFNVNSIAQIAALAALKNWDQVDNLRGKIELEKKKFYNCLDQNKIDYIKSYANFILIETGKNTRSIIEDLLKQGFIVRPGYNLGVGGFIRVTISLGEINDLFLDRFIKIYESYNNL